MCAIVLPILHRQNIWSAFFVQAVDIEVKSERKPQIEHSILEKGTPYPN